MSVISQRKVLAYALTVRDATMKKSEADRFLRPKGVAMPSFIVYIVSRLKEQHFRTFIPV